MNSELMQEIYKLKEEKAKIEADIEASKSHLKSLTELIDEKSDALLYDMLNENIDYNELDDIVAAKLTRKAVRYSNEENIIKELKEKYAGEYIRTKVTESLDKINFKKAIKQNKEFSEEMSKYVMVVDDPYVVVTSKENYKLMLEHLNND